jgi:flavin reductase (DIM6/NTAB) family NADH-FMN oxidoreductase RutF
MKDTARNITHSKEFVIHVSDESIIEEINKTAASLPADQSELEQTTLSLMNSERISVPGILNAKIRFECKLEQHLTFANDQNEETTDLIIGRVLCYHLDEKVYNPEKGYILSEHLAPVCRLAGNDYAKLGKKFKIERPL